LFVNGESQGFGSQSSRFLYIFKNVLWQPGVVRAVGYDAHGKKICETEINTAGKPFGIRLSVHTGPSGLRADGADLALVDVEVVDAAGNRCPTALNLINFSISGPAEWRGGIAQGPDNYILAKTLPVECGINRVLVRSAPDSGLIRLKAEADGLKPAVVEIASRAVKSVDGLSLDMPDAGLSANLTRGPTPAARPLLTSRTPIRIVNASAGANGATAALSFDDNEATSWSNDGRLDSAWIIYELDRPASINEVTLKLGSWRTRSYPIRISVDDRTVFNGNTSPSLGYVTFTFPPTLGRHVKIELTGEPKDANNAGNAIGITGNSEFGPKSTAFSIFEVEIYEPTSRRPR